MTFLTSLRFSGLFGVEGMGGVAAVASVLNVVTPFAKCPFKGVGKSLVLRVVLYPVPGDRVSSLLELVIFL
jgi:hypothetical protein